MRKGFVGITIVLGLLIIVTIAGGIYYFKFSKSRNGLSLNFSQTTYSPESSDSTNIIDEAIRNEINIGAAVLKDYFVENNSYPKDLANLKEGYNGNYATSTLIDSLLKSPISYKSDGVNYDFYATLNSGEIFRGDQVNINKILDQGIKNDLYQLVSAVNAYYGEKSKLPQNLDELTGVILRRALKNPITGKLYDYSPNPNGSNFTVSGVLSDGSTYQQHY